MPGRPETVDPKPVYDLVNHPPHYTEGRKIEPIDVIEDWRLPYGLGCVVKYVARCGRKGGPSDTILDLKKAIFYLQREVARREVLTNSERS